MKPILGGFVTCRPKPIELACGKEQGLTLLSDLHLGAPNVNLSLIKRELRNARRRQDRILINGDVFDGILHSDAKRFSPDVLHPRLQGRRDVLNSAVDWAVEIFKPYAALIDVIGIGNHESALEKHHSFDPTKVLVRQLQKLAKPSGHTVHYGGFTGYVHYRISGIPWVLYYHHGSGGASLSNRGISDFDRKNQFVSADCIWMGHKHHRWTAHVRRIECPDHGEGPLVKDVRYIMTGAYLHTYTGQSQRSLRKNGRRTNYAADAGYPTQGQGGARVVLRRGKCGLEAKVEM